MNLNKNLLLIGAIIGIGLFVLPSTLSMFAGQHTWYDPDGGVPCEKCHFLEEQELVNSGGPHDPSGTYTQYNSSMSYSSSIWAAGPGTTSSRCLGCHQGGSFDNNTQHAAFAILCTDCHPWVINELQASGAAHGEFYDAMAAAGEDSLRTSNKACIGCHTMVGVNTSWERAAYVAYTVTVSDTGVYTIAWNTSDGFGTNASQSGSHSEY